MEGECYAPYGVAFLCSMGWMLCHPFLYRSFFTPALLNILAIPPPPPIFNHIHCMVSVFTIDFRVRLENSIDPDQLVSQKIYMFSKVGYIRAHEDKKLRGI